MKAEIVQKESISSLSFPQDEVLHDDQKKKERYFHLQDAMKYGNMFRQKVKIYFMDSEHTKAVETTIWYANEHHAILKGGVVLPVRRVLGVKIL